MQKEKKTTDNEILYSQNRSLQNYMQKIKKTTQLQELFYKYKRLWIYYYVACLRIWNKICYSYRSITDHDRIFHYAASLSFYSIFSIIPVFLMLFSLFASFPSFQGQLQTFKEFILNNTLPNNAEELSMIVDSFLSNGKEMGFIGFLVSLISSFIFFRNFDDISARIFSAKKRGYFDSFIIYWLLITLMPLFIATSIYVNTVLINLYSNVTLNKIYKFTPLFASWLMFAMLFRIAANKSLKLWLLLFSSLIGAVIWYGLKFAFFYYMSYNEFYKTIYGSVSIVMFVFLWIYISWIVILFAMRLCKWLDSHFPDS